MKMYFDKLLTYSTLFLSTYLHVCLSICLLFCLTGQALTGRISPDMQAKPGQVGQARTRSRPDRITPKLALPKQVTP